MIEIVGMRDVIREWEGNARFNIRLLSGELGIPVHLVYSTYNINATGTGCTMALFLLTEVFWYNTLIIDVTQVTLQQKYPQYNYF